MYTNHCIDFSIPVASMDTDVLRRSLFAGMEVVPAEIADLFTSLEAKEDIHSFAYEHTENGLDCVFMVNTIHQDEAHSYEFYLYIGHEYDTPFHLDDVRKLHWAVCPDYDVLEKELSIVGYTDFLVLTENDSQLDLFNKKVHRVSGVTVSIDKTKKERGETVFTLDIDPAVRIHTECADEMGKGSIIVTHGYDPCDKVETGDLVFFSSGYTIPDTLAVRVC